LEEDGRAFGRSTYKKKGGGPKDRNIIWPNQEEDIYNMRTKSLPLGTDPFEPYQTELDNTKPINIDTDEDFAKALTYLSTIPEPDEFIPKKKEKQSNARGDPDPNKQLEEADRADQVLHDEDKDEDDEKTESEEQFMKFPHQIVLRLKRHAQITAAGRIYSWSSFVLLGTGKGCCGLGYGRGNSPAEAIAASKKQAQKRLLTINLWRGNNIGSDIFQKYKKSWIWMKARRPGNGATYSYKLRTTILEPFGIDDVVIGVGGRKNKLNIYKAFFKGLKEQPRTPEQIAQTLGKKYFNSANIYYNTTD